MKTAEETLKEFIPNGCINLKSYKEEKELIIAAMEAYKNQSQPIEKEQKIMAAKEHFEVERTLWSMEVLEKEQEIERLREALQRIDPTNPALESSPTEQPEAQTNSYVIVNDGNTVTVFKDGIEQQNQPQPEKAQEEQSETQEEMLSEIYDLWDAGKSVLDIFTITRK